MVSGWIGGAWILIVLIAGCTTSPNPRSCFDGTCDDPAYPFCDFDGDIAGIPTACIAVSCTPGASDACRADRAVTCNAAGDNYELVPCEHGCNEGTHACNQCEPSTSRCEGGVFQACDAEGRLAIEEACALGCVDGPAPHCAYLEPRYLPDICDTRATLDELTIASTASFDTDLDTNCTGGVVAQTGGPSICVVRYKTITIATGAKLRVHGSRVVAFVADRELTVAGVLDVSADRSTNGPGGGTIVSGGSPNPTQGGGGAGFMTLGGAGGTSLADGGAGNGGPATLDPALLAALIGGPRSNGPETAYGGGGGGATLIACRGALSVTGVIDAGGGGGRGGITVFNTAFHGFGGGAGGNVVLQSMNIIVTGGVFANGGGGGSGKPIPLTEGGSGDDGYPSATATGGGGTSVIGGGAGNGGNGGRAGAQPAAGARPMVTGATSGGGGGSVGFLQSYTPSGVSPTLTPSAASPSFQPNGAIRTR